jgi:hypothetical protein
MTVIIEQPSKNLREELAALRAILAAAQTETFWFTGNSVLTTYALPAGWASRLVFVNGALVRPGVGEAYTLTFDGFIHRVVFAVAPAAVSIAIIAQRNRP